MSSVKHCCVPGCTESGEGDQPLHRFPNPELDKERFNTWLYTIGGDIIGLENEFIFKYRRVCRRHFEATFLCCNSRLSNIATPTLNMPDLRSPWKYNFGGRKPMHPVQNYETDSVIMSEDLSLATLACSEIATTDTVPSTSTMPVAESNLGERAPRKMLRRSNKQLFFTEAEIALRKNKQQK